MTRPFGAYVICARCHQCAKLAKPIAVVKEGTDSEDAIKWKDVGRRSMHRCIITIFMEQLYIDDQAEVD